MCSGFVNTPEARWTVLRRINQLLFVTDEGQELQAFVYFNVLVTNHGRSAKEFLSFDSILYRGERHDAAHEALALPAYFNLRFRREHKQQPNDSKAAGYADRIFMNRFSCESAHNHLYWNLRRAYISTISSASCASIVVGFRLCFTDWL